jgi:hypothetical protein
MVTAEDVDGREKRCSGPSDIGFGLCVTEKVKTTHAGGSNNFTYVLLLPPSWKVHNWRASTVERNIAGQTLGGKELNPKACRQQMHTIPLGLISTPLYDGLIRLRTGTS